MSWDSPEPIPTRLKDAYPFVTFLETGGGKGAGFARNRGIEIAKAPLICGLDADDWLYPEFLERCIPAYNDTGHAIYTDYIGKALVDDKKYIKSLESKGRLIAWDGLEAVILFKAFNFDCDRALREPSGKDFYVWCNITTIHPKAGGPRSAASMNAYPPGKTGDYFLRLVQRGHCFTRLEEPLMVYRFYTGTRRDAAHRQVGNGHLYDFMIKYLQDKYAVLRAEGKVMGCGGCGKKSVTGRSADYDYQQKEESMNDTDQVMVEYRHPNKGDHWVGSPSGLKTEEGRPGMGCMYRGLVPGVCRRRESHAHEFHRCRNYAEARSDYAE